MSNYMPLSQTTLYLVRTGEPLNEDGVFLGHLVRVGLSKEGVYQSRDVAQYFQNEGIPVSAVFHSPLLRTRQTARIIGKELKAPTVKHSNQLSEIVSPWEGKPIKDYLGRNGDIYADLTSGYESQEDIVNRMRHFTQRVVRQYFNRHVIAVSHAEVITYGILWAIGADISVEARNSLDFYPEYGSITKLVFKGSGGSASVEYIGRKDVKAALS